MKKLLRYDLKSVFRIWWVALLVVCVIFVFSCFGTASLRDALYNNSYNPFDSESYSDWISRLTSGAILTFLGAATIWAFGVLGLVMPLIRYCQSFFTDQAYLTFTLPVKNKTLYHSKLITAMIFYGITLVIQVLLASVLVLIFLHGDPLEDLMGNLDADVIWVYSFKLLLYAVQGAGNVLTWHFAFNMGGILAKSNKGLFITLAVFSTLIAKGIIQSVFKPVLFINSDLLSADGLWISQVLSTVVLVFLELVLAMVCYLVSRHLFEKKVNLA